MGVVALRRSRGWTIVNDNGEALALTQAEAETLRTVLSNELGAKADPKPQAVSPAKARFTSGR